MIPIIIVGKAVIFLEHQEVKFGLE